MKKYLILIVFSVLLFSSNTRAQKFQIGFNLFENFGNENIDACIGGGIDLNILIKNNFYLKTSVNVLPTNRKYNDKYDIIKNDYLQKSFTETLIYSFKIKNLKPFLGLGFGYYLRNNIEFEFLNVSIDFYSLAMEKIREKIGYHFCIGICSPISNELEIEAGFWYYILRPSVEQRWEWGFSTNPHTAYKYLKGNIKLDSSVFRIGIYYNFGIN